MGLWLGPKATFLKTTSSFNNFFPLSWFHSPLIPQQSWDSVENWHSLPLLFQVLFGLLERFLLGPGHAPHHLAEGSVPSEWVPGPCPPSGFCTFSHAGPMAHSACTRHGPPLAHAMGTPHSLQLYTTSGFHVAATPRSY